MTRFARYLGLVETTGRMQHVTFRPTHGNGKDPSFSFRLGGVSRDLALDVAHALARRLQEPSATANPAFVRNVVGHSLRHLVRPRR